MLLLNEHVVDYRLRHLCMLACVEGAQRFTQPGPTWSLLTSPVEGTRVPGLTRRFQGDCHAEPAQKF